MSRDTTLRWVKDNWLIISFLVSLIVGWTNLHNSSADYGRRIEKVEKETQEHHDMLIELKTVAQTIEKMDRKMDRMDRWLRKP